LIQMIAFLVQLIPALFFFSGEISDGRKVNLFF